MPTPACTCVSLHDHGAGRCVQVSKKRGKSAGIVERLLVLLRENQEQLQRYHALRTAMAQPPQLPDELLALDNSEDSGDDDDGGGDGVSIGGEEAERQPQREEREGESEEEKEEEGETGEEEKENEEEEGGTVERCDSADASGRSDVQDPKPRVCSEREEARAARERQREADRQRIKALMPGTVDELVNGQVESLEANVSHLDHLITSLQTTFDMRDE